MSIDQTSKSSKSTESFQGSVTAPSPQPTKKRSALPIVSPFERVFDGPLTQDLLLKPAQFGLGLVPQNKRPDATTSMVCGFCATGCSLNIHLEDGNAINLTPACDYPVNTGMACPKGWEALTPLSAPDRGVSPMLHSELGNEKGAEKSKDRSKGKLVAVDWHQAMTEFCSRFKAIQEKHGPESVAFLGTGQMPTEETAFLGVLAKFGMGMKHGDGNTRQCMATAATAYKQSFGFDAPPYTYEDLEQSDVIVLIGSNLCIAHPVMWQRILQNENSPEVIVVDPRKTETAVAATQHFAIQPKSDLDLFYGIAHILIEEDWIDHDFISRHVNDFDAFKEHVIEFTPQRVAMSTGISVERLHYLAHTINKGKRVSFWWTMGVNQSYQGTRTAQAIINLALMTGNIGRPGTGANSITGQCNAMGARLFSNTTSLLGGHDFGNADHRLKVAKVMGIDPTVIPTEASDSYDQIVENILKGKIRGLWILATNPAHSWINQNLYRDILDRLDFLVVQDMYPTTETAELADLYLPAAGWGEKDGTFINSERRVGVIKKVARAPGKTLSDFSIFQLIAQYWGCGEMFKKWTDPESVFKILAATTQDQPCDITGITSYQMLDEQGGIQWPLPQNRAPNSNPNSNQNSEQNSNQAMGHDPIPPKQHRRLFEDGVFYHSDGKAKMLFAQPRAMPEPVTENFPLVLLTGRGSAAQWHTQTRTAKSPVLQRLSAKEAYVEINPKDAKSLKIRPNQKVLVASQRGRIPARALITPTVQPGQVFMPMHYPEVNQLTLAHFDPYSRQPSYKNCAVNVVADE